MSKKQKPIVRKCVVCGEARVDGEGGRGQCSRDYQASRNAVINGETTWEELEARGLALPKGKAGRPRTAPIHAALKQASAK